MSGKNSWSVFLNSPPPRGEFGSGCLIVDCDREEVAQTILIEIVRSEQFGVDTRDVVSDRVLSLRESKFTDSPERPDSIVATGDQQVGQAIAIEIQRHDIVTMFVLAGRDCLAVFEGTVTLSLEDVDLVGGVADRRQIQEAVAVPVADGRCPDEKSDGDRQGRAEVPIADRSDGVSRRYGITRHEVVDTVAIEIGRPDPECSRARMERSLDLSQLPSSGFCGQDRNRVRPVGDGDPVAPTGKECAGSDRDGTMLHRMMGGPSKGPIT